MTMSTDVSSSFREAMAGVCSPVVVVTSHDDDRPHGTTVSAFMSLSMNPPMIAVALDHESDLLAMITERRRFAINVLSSAQSDLALTFARKGSAKFDRVRWSERGGVPVIDEVAGWLTCEVVDVVAGGDHQMLFGAVDAAAGHGRPPLTYHDRRFGTHVPHIPTAGGARA